MIVDTIQNASKYFSVHPLFAKAFEYIKQTDLDTIEMGRYEIDGDKLKAIFSNKKGSDFIFPTSALPLGGNESFFTTSIS